MNYFRNADIIVRRTVNPRPLIESGIPHLRHLSQYFDKYNLVVCVCLRQLKKYPCRYFRERIPRNYRTCGSCQSIIPPRTILGGSISRLLSNLGIAKSFYPVKSRVLSFVLTVALTCGANRRGVHWI